MTNLGLLAVCADMGALLPDLDAAKSKVKHIRMGQAAQATGICAAPLSDGQAPQLQRGTAGVYEAQ